MIKPEYQQILQQKPVRFVEKAFNESLWDKQVQIIESIRDNKYTTVRSCYDSGKSFIGARSVLWFLTAFPNSKIISTAPTFRQVKDILWREIHTAYNKSKVQLGGNLLDTAINIDSDWFAAGISTNDPTSFQGYHAVYLLLIIDEAAGISEEIFQASEGLLSSEHARVLYIGNPTNTDGTFYRSFKQANFHHISISAFDTPNFTAFGITIEDIRANTWKEKINSPLPSPYLITPEWVYDKYIRWGESSPLFQALVLGVFPEQGEDVLIPLHKIEEAALRHLEVKEEDPETIGADIARFGSDRTEFALRKGSKVTGWKTFNHMDTVQTGGHLQTYMGFHPHASVRVDEIGVGAGVLDTLQANKPAGASAIIGVNVAKEPRNKEMFINQRAEYYWGLRERFIDGDIDLSGLEPVIIEELTAQLSSIKFEFTPRGQIKIESKDDMKKRGLPSPDKADALMLAFANVDEDPGLVGYLKSMA